ncbi:MAG: CheR family methyltransferase [Janthinobacterium lividum]
MTDATNDPTASTPPPPDPTQSTASQPKGSGLGHLLAPSPGDKFHIVAIGGSAGSLDALERFFRNLPAHTGMAFVVVVHLLPTQASELAQVLQNFTPLPVHQIEDGMRVRPDHVYVIPPGRDLSILHGTLLLLHPTQPPGRRMPIDFFLESLAKDAQERAVSITLSGLGTDGSVGLKLVMENFGMVMVQDPATAAYPSMPVAAIATEFVDFVLAPELMGSQVLDYAERPLLTRPPRELEEPGVQPAHALQKIFTLIRTQTGHDFSYYKRNTVFRRIERRMNAHQIREFTHYVRYLQENPREVEQLFKELLIGVTKFFRDAEAFAHLKGYLLTMLAKKPADSTVRVWAPGCSTGEEAYSLAMLLLECFDELPTHHHLKIQIFATDISADSIDFARAAIYPDNITGDVSAERLARFFQKQDDHYLIRKEVRDCVVFAVHNINKDAPFTKLDLLCCRNLLIYLNTELQKKLMPVFHYALNVDGLLFLGPSENINTFQDLFQLLDLKWKISRRTNVALSLSQLASFPFTHSRHPSLPAHSPTLLASSSMARRDGGPFASLVQKELLRAYTPPAVVINPKGEILYVNGRTGRYLEPAPGLSGMNLFEMARDKLNFEVSGAVHRALQTHEDVVVNDVPLHTEAGQQLLRLSVRHLLEPEPLAGLLLVSFEDQPTPRRVRRAKGGVGANREYESVVAALNKELQFTKHRLQTTVEEMESSLEELKSTNEELQSANEELQSTNEEAMTNKEEMQSLNEELMTLNLQYQSKSEELGHAANDMKNLLDATDIALIFLDNDLLIKRFTPSVLRIINLVPADVGRPLVHFASNLRYPHLLRDVQQVLDRLTSQETNIQTTTNEWYTMRILPYRTLDNYINGAIITFTRITGLKTLEAQLQETANFLGTLQNAVHEPIVALDQHLRVYFSSQSFAELFALTPADLIGQSLLQLSLPWGVSALRDRLEELLDPAVARTTFDDFVLEADLPALGPHRLHLYARLLHHPGQPTDRVLLGVQRLEPAG